MYLRIEMLKAGSGDSLWIECGRDQRSITRVVIDGGNDDDLIARKLKTLLANEQVIDLWIVTHTDDDHIKGVLTLKNLGVDVREMWFNAPEGIRDPSDQVLSYWQGDQLAEILRSRKTRTKWINNVSSDREIEFKLRNDVGILKVLGPKRKSLDDLYRHWRTNALGEGRRMVEPTARPDLTDDVVGDLAKMPDKTPNNSITNAGSIIVLLELNGDELPGKEPRRYLFPGDAPPALMIEAIQKLKGSAEQLKLDGFKLSHHASDRSISKKLLELLDCRHFYISTNGMRHGLPNDSAIAKVIRIAKATHLFFNYEEVGARWLKYVEKAGRGLKVKIPEEGHDYVVVASEDVKEKEGRIWIDTVDRLGKPSWDGLTIKVDPAGEKLKVTFQESRDAEPRSWRADWKGIKDGCDEIRKRMETLAITWPERSKFDDELKEVASICRFVYNSLFEGDELAQKHLEQAPPKTTIVFKSPEVSIPVPFLYSGADPIDTKNFWAFRYSLFSPFSNFVTPANFVYLDLASYIGVSGYTNVYEAHVGSHHEVWLDFRDNWHKKNNCLSHFFCHHEDGRLSSKEKPEAVNFWFMADLATQRKKNKKGPDLLFINACNTHELIKNAGWKNALSSEVFGGFLGTEATIHNAAAQLFAKEFFRNLLLNADVNEAFEAARHSTWPASLYYSMNVHPELAAKMFLAPVATAQNA